MNARIRYGLGALTAAALMLLAGGCDDASEYYYTTSYPVVRIEVSVTVEEETPEPQPEPEPEPEPEYEPINFHSPDLLELDSELEVELDSSTEDVESAELSEE